jgi:hypothetical protein
MFKFKTLALAALALVAVTAVSLSTTAIAGNQHRVRARMSGNTLASGKADYRERMRNGTLEQRFSVEVEDATPGDVMQININGTLFGTIVIDDLGVGELQYRTPAFIDDPGDGDPIPDGFPTLIAGDQISVGPLSGVFQNH